VPDEVVLRCGLAAGTTLDRPLLRELRRELLAVEALTTASRALARSDMSRRRLAARLEHAGVAREPQLGAIAALAAVGALDDARLARHRATRLAERAWGNGAIAERLEAEGIAEPDARAAIETLPPEAERAAAAVADLTDRRKAWARLARRGFAPDTIEAVIGLLDEDAGGWLG
jgi:SOS response regulatory protein OraA/RecX